MIIHYTNQERPPDYRLGEWSELFALRHQAMKERSFIDRIDLTRDEEQWLLRDIRYFAAMPDRPDGVRVILGIPYTVQSEGRW